MSRSIPEHHEFIIIHSNEGDRMVTTIAGHPFYQSTGVNSQHAGTWFPFNGISELGPHHIIAPLGRFIKPHDWTENLSKEIGFFKENFRDLDSDFFERCGGIDGICLSYSMGGGFWKTTKAQKLIGYLERKLQPLLSITKALVSSKFSATSDSPPKIHLFQDKENIRFINEWLHKKTGRELLFFPGTQLVIAVTPIGKNGKVSYHALYGSSVHTSNSRAHANSQETQKERAHSPITHTEIIKKFFDTHQTNSTYWTDDRKRNATIDIIVAYANQKPLDTGKLWDNANDIAKMRATLTQLGATTTDDDTFIVDNVIEAITNKILEERAARASHLIPAQSAIK